MDIQTIQAERRTYSEQTHTHDHPFAQLILPLHGTLFIETPHHQLTLNDSRLFFLHPYCQHSFHANTQNEFLVLDIPAELLIQETPTGQNGGLSLILDDRWHALRALFLAELSDSCVSPHASSNSSNSAHPLLHLARYACSLLQQNTAPRSIQFIHAHFHRSINLNELAKLEGYTPTYYCDWFKKQTGMTPKAYIQTLRLQYAKELLAHTDLPILHIAQQVGYEHHSSLTRLFQHHEQITPIAYRQTLRKTRSEN